MKMSDKVMVYQYLKKNNITVNNEELLALGNLRFVISELMKEQNVSFAQLSNETKFSPEIIEDAIKGKLDLNLTSYIFRELCDYFNLDKEVYWKYTNGRTVISEKGNKVSEFDFAKNCSVDTLRVTNQLFMEEIQNEFH